LDNIVIQEKHIISRSSETEGGLRPSGVSDDRPNPEVIEKPKRRRYTEKYKRKIVEEVGILRQNGDGQIGEYLRKEGIYYSMVMRWTKNLRQSSEKKSKVGRKEKSREEFQDEIEKLKKELKRVQKKLAKSELLIEIQKKISKMIQLKGK
jgi:transposase